MYIWYFCLLHYFFWMLSHFANVLFLWPHFAHVLILLSHFACVSLLAAYQSLLFFIFIFLCYHILHMCLFATFLLLLELMTFYKCGCQCLLFIYLFCICEYTKTLLHSMEYYQLFIKALLSQFIYSFGVFNYQLCNKLSYNKI